MSTSHGAPIAGTGPAAQATRYRWVVMAVIFVSYVVCMADRANIGAVLPFVKEEFHIDNFTIGAISSFLAAIFPRSDAIRGTLASFSTVRAQGSATSSRS